MLGDLSFIEYNIPLIGGSANVYVVERGGLKFYICEGLVDWGCTASDFILGSIYGVCPCGSVSNSRDMSGRSRYSRCIQPKNP